jgi:hypothetical protein
MSISWEIPRLRFFLYTLYTRNTLKSSFYYIMHGGVGVQMQFT